MVVYLTDSKHNLMGKLHINDILNEDSNPVLFCWRAKTNRDLTGTVEGNSIPHHSSCNTPLMQV